MKVRRIQRAQPKLCTQLAVSITASGSRRCVRRDDLRFSDRRAVPVNDGTAQIKKLSHAIRLCFFSGFHRQFRIDLIVKVLPFHADFFPIRMSNSGSVKHCVVVRKTHFPPLFIPQADRIYLPIRLMGCHICLKGSADIAVSSGNQDPHTLVSSLFLSDAPSTTPSCRRTLPMVPKKHLQSKAKLRFRTYSPS